MPPLVHIMRHGEGFHSEAVTPDGHKIRDPWLTPHGEQQCAERCAAFTRHDKIDLLLASPLRRALQTCLLTFTPSVNTKGMKVLALPIAEEASDAPCDTGSDIEILRKEFPEKVDFEYVKSGWYLHEGEYATDPKALNARAAKLRRFIRGRPEKEIALVTHGFFAHFLTGDVDEEGKQTTPWWGETELRTFRFVDDEEAALIEEVEESGARRERKGHDLIVNDPRLR